MNLIELEDMEFGDKVIFRGFSNPLHTHWGFTEGKEYTVGERRGVAGPKSDPHGEVPTVNWGFRFERVEGKLDHSELVVGDNLMFLGFIPAPHNGFIHSHWSYKVGKVYTVVEDGLVPRTDDGEQPHCNWGFRFRKLGKVVEKSQEPSSASHREQTVNILTNYLRK